MYISTASTFKKIGYGLLYSCLASTIFLFFTARPTAAQEKLTLSEPLKRCRTFGGNNGLTRAVASDNDNNFLLTTDNLSIISFDPDLNKENWKSLTGGRLESDFLDGENLYFIASFENENRQKAYTLNSISLKTGITNWQMKLNEHYQIRINRIESKSTLYLTVDNKLILAIEKKDGKINWTKQYSAKIVSVSKRASTAEELYIATEDSLIRALAGNGETLSETRFKKSEISEILIGNEYVLNSYMTGEIIKISISDTENEVVWKLRAGAGISGMVEYSNELLVTSLDNFIYLYSTESGKLRWKKRVAGRINNKPQILGSLAVVVNSGDNSVAVLDLRDGKIINQIIMEPETYLTGQPLISGRYLALHTSKGIQFYTNVNSNCK